MIHLRQVYNFTIKQRKKNTHKDHNLKPLRISILVNFEWVPNLQYILSHAYQGGLDWLKPNRKTKLNCGYIFIHY